MFRSLREKGGDTMAAESRAGFLLIKSLMTCLAIITLRASSMFIRLRSAR